MIRIKFVQTAADRASCFQIRDAVFCTEQKVPVAIERDTYDADALHFLAVDDGQPVGTARVVMKDNGKTAKIGRVAVLALNRGAGIGKLLLAAIEASPALQQVDHFALEAQTHALKFYTALGYVAHGDEFIEAGIPHFKMRKPKTQR